MLRGAGVFLIYGICVGPNRYATCDGLAVTAVTQTLLEGWDDLRWDTRFLDEISPGGKIMVGNGIHGVRSRVWRLLPRLFGMLIPLLK